MYQERVILLSLSLKWWEKIVAGEKVIEVRKTKPSDINPGDRVRVIVYVTGGLGVAGEFCVQDFVKINVFPKPFCNSWMDICKCSCLSVKELQDYTGTKEYLWGWVVSNVKDYHNFKKLSEYGIFKPPQSWMYLRNGGKYGKRT